MSGACNYCGKPIFYENGVKHHKSTGNPAEYLPHEDLDGNLVRPECVPANQWDDARYVAQQKAYGDGEYDGYWGTSPRGGIYTALERVLYLRGYLAGVKERQQEPSDEQINAWMRTIGANDE